MSTIEKHNEDYKTDAWKQYSMQELGQWVHLLYTRAQHRDNPVKREKDLQDAINYLEMMKLKLLGE